MEPHGWRVIVEREEPKAFSILLRNGEHFIRRTKATFTNRGALVITQKRFKGFDHLQISSDFGELVYMGREERRRFSIWLATAALAEHDQEDLEREKSILQFRRRKVVD